MKVILTGFEPFDKNDINPSWEAVKKVHDIDGIEIIKLKLPVVYEKASNMLINKVEEEKPDIVISTGLAISRTEVTVERVAININDASIPDNNGVLLRDSAIYPDGENAYFATLPLRNIVDAINEKGIKASISNSAGTYVCNNVMYSLLYYIDKNDKNISGGFIHLPYDLSDNMVKALETAIKETVKSRV